MKGLATRITKALQVGSQLLCDDNSGAKIVQIIGVIGVKAKRGKIPNAGIGDVIIVAVKKGNPQMRKKVERAVIVRQRKEFRRLASMRFQFEDNACVLIGEDGLPKATEIKGAIAREVAERYPKVAAIAAAVV